MYSRAMLWGYDLHEAARLTLFCIAQRPDSHHHLRYQAALVPDPDNQCMSGVPNPSAMLTS